MEPRLDPQHLVSDICAPNARLYRPSDPHLENEGSTGASLVTQTVKNLPAVQETKVRSLGWEHPLEKEMTIHSRRQYTADHCTRQERIFINESQPSISMGPPRPWIRPSMDHVAFIIENYSCINGPVQFRPSLFRGQLYW